MKKHDHNEIMIELGSISSSVKRIDDHLKELNSKVAKNVNEIQELKVDEAVAEYKRRAYQETQEDRAQWEDWMLKGVLSVAGLIVLVAILSALEGVNLVELI